MSEFKSEMWHLAYVRWYDHERDGHRVREWVWARIADGLSWAFWGVR